MTINVANVTTAGNVVYPSIGNTAVTYFALCNYGTGNVTANVYVVPSGQTIGNSNILVNQIVISPTDTFLLYIGAEKLLLGNGDSIQSSANANTVTSTTSYTTI